MQERAGVRSDVRIVAVTKGHPVTAVEAAAACGITEVGENRVQEALSKQDAATNLRVSWHLIGHLQTNKAKHVAGRFSMVQSVDSVKVAEALSRALVRKGRVDDPLAVLLQVNVAREPQKSGCTPEGAGEIASAILENPALELRGLMTMAPFDIDEGEQRRIFGSLRHLRDRLETEGYCLPELSMGMSSDYRAAVAEGATILRLGTVLFGERAK